MSQRINVRVADARRGSQAFVAIVAVLLLVGVGVGGWWFYTTKMAGKGTEGTKKTAADSVKSYVEDLESKLNAIVKEPAKASEQVTEISTLAGNEEIEGIVKQVKDAPADVKASVAAMVAAKLKDLQPLIDKVYAAAPAVKDQLEPLITKIMTALKGLAA